MLAHKPTALTVEFGMNDGNYRALDEPGFKACLSGLQGMADQARAAGIRVAWMTPQPLDNGDQGSTALTGYNLTLEKYSAGVKSIAEGNGGLFADQFHPYLASSVILWGRTTSIPFFVFDARLSDHPRYLSLKRTILGVY